MSDQPSLPIAEVFEPLGALPRRRMAIEASAGTGKTHALATLATRFVAESGVAASELLIVTFTRAAANELRAKVRQRLMDTAGVLETGSSDRVSDFDGLTAHLSSSDRLERTQRLQRAVTEFDSATITTIHGFAFQVRAALGIGTGAGPNDRILSDHRALLREACTDVLADAAVGQEADLGLPDLEALVRFTEQVDGRPDLVLFPPADLAGELPPLSALATLVTRSAELGQRRRRAAGMLSFDDVLTRFRGVLADPSIGVSAARYLTARYRVVLIDEFQDTDPVQWDIFSSLFGKEDGRSTLVVVGDPKQSIYGFRGADVHTYQRAVEDPDTVRQVLRTNWRSDEALLDALSSLLNGATFGEGIRFMPVEAAPGHSGRMLDADGHLLAALSLRLAVHPDITRNQRFPDLDLVTVGPAKAAILSDLAATVCRLLDTAVIPSADESVPVRPVRPGDIAVLVPKNQDALDVQSGLREASIPAVVTRAGSVLESEAATQLRWLLYAMERPSDLTRVRLAGLSWFGGWTARQVAEAGDADPDGALATLQERLRGWADALSSQPVAAVLARIRSESGLLGRLLAQPEGDRNVTDLDHLCELLGSSTASGRSGPAALLACLDEEPEPTGDGDAIIDVDEDLTARRLESDADCVQVMTTWTAKGLEFPIVCLPMLWWESNSPVAPPDEYVEPASGRRTIDLTVGKKDYGDFPDPEAAAERQALIDRETDDERLRTLYVALTRAQHMDIVWWARTEQSEYSAMARILFGRADGVMSPELFSAHRVSVPADGQVDGFLAPVVAEANRRHAGAMTVEKIAPATLVPVWQDPAARHIVTDLEVAVAPVPDRRYQRWSFSAIVDRTAVEQADPADDSLADAGAADEAEGAMDMELEAMVDGDQGMRVAAYKQDPLVPVASTVEPIEAGVNPMADLMGGATFGTLVHSVLERVDWQARDLDDALGEAVDECLARRPVELVTAVPSQNGDDAGSSGRASLIAGLRTALLTPLGPQFANVRLADLGARDRIAELTFDLRLGTDGGLPTTRLFGETVRDALPEGDPCASWAEALAGGARDLVLAGNLTGSIDLVARVQHDDDDPRFVIADYKTNSLHPPGTTARAADYEPRQMTAAMAEHDYPLQALLYSVALHRYLRWRLPDYEPRRHLGGVAYLFVRGMNGRAAAGGTANGVFSWMVPPRLVEDLSDLLDGAPVGAPA